MRQWTTRVLPPLLLAAVVLAFLQTGWLAQLGDWLDTAIHQFCADWRDRHGVDTLLGSDIMVLGLLGGIPVSLICGAVSSLVVSNRMAFFSDALAHCAFAGVALGLILSLLGVVPDDPEGLLPVMILFGILVGIAIAFVKEQTTLANDTVIGVFFAGAMGLGAVLLKGISRAGLRGFSPENFLFGDLLGINGQDLVFLALLLLATGGLLYWLYNQLVFISFSPSLARSRRFSVRLANYLLIVLLALIVNICLKVVGALLINALLILPGAAASNLSRNLRQFFWLSALLSFIAGMGGLLLSFWWVPVLGGRAVPLGSGGLIVVIGVVIFFLSMPCGRLLRGARTGYRTGY